MSRSAMGLALVACLAAPAVLSADATHNSHLTCFKIRDNIPKKTYTATVVGETCTIKVPAKLACVNTSKTGVTPGPPGGGPDIDLNETLFFCYKQKCPRTSWTRTAKDQFGTHTINSTSISLTLLCAPASPSGAFLDDSAVF